MKSSSRKRALLAELSCLDDDGDPDQSGLVGQLVNETSMGDLDKLLIVPLAHVRFLFPKGISADDERADPLAHQSIDDTADGFEIKESHMLLPERVKASGTFLTVHQGLDVCQIQIILLMG
jgi:hypothetical protein